MFPENQPAHSPWWKTTKMCKNTVYAVKPHNKRKGEKGGFFIRFERAAGESGFKILADKNCPQKCFLLPRALFCAAATRLLLSIAEQQQRKEPSFIFSRLRRPEEPRRRRRQQLSPPLPLLSPPLLLLRWRRRLLHQFTRPYRPIGWPSPAQPWRLI